MIYGYALFTVLGPVFFLIIVAWSANDFINKLNDKRPIREKEISKKVLFPKQLRNELVKDTSIIKRDAITVSKSYKRCFYVFITYGIFWLFFIAGIITNIILLTTGKYSNLSAREIAVVIGSVIFGILLFYWFVLTPMFEILHLYKLAEFGKTLWTLLQKSSQFVTNKIIILGKYLLEIFLSIVAFYFYTKLIGKLNIALNISTEQWIIVPELMIYQYPLLRIVTFLISWILNLLPFIKNKLNAVNLYNSLQNASYLSMVFVYTYAQYNGKIDSVLPVAIGILFLFDTYFKQSKENKNKK